MALPFYRSDSDLSFDLEPRMERVTLREKEELEQSVKLPPISTGPAFGSSSARFGIISSHPLMWTTITNTNFPRKYTGASPGVQLSPATYNIRRIWEKQENDLGVKGRGWARQKFLEDLSKLPSIVQRDLFEGKRELRRRLGPGKYDICREEKKPGSNKAPMDIRTKHLRQDPRLRRNLPGPGTYGKGGIPGRQLGIKKQYGIYTYLEKSICNREMRAKDAGLEAGLYNFEDPVKKLINSSVGKRGPYDLFTAERDDPIKTGHRPPLIHAVTLKTDYKAHKTLLEHLYEPHNKKKGKFSTAPKYPNHSGERIMYDVLPVPVPDCILPGPGDYDLNGGMARWLVEEKKLQKIKALREKNPHYGFLRGSKRVQNFQRSSFKVPGPGRYDIKRLYSGDEIKKATNMQKSTGFNMDPRIHNIWRERLRPKNVQLQNRINYMFSFLGW